MVLRFVVLLAHAPAAMPLSCPKVGITQQTGVTERNTTGIPAAVLLYSFIYAFRRLQGTAVVSNGRVAESSVSMVQDA
jgi:hypothetical protein